MEAAPRFDGCADHDELGAVLRGDARDVPAEAPRPRADDLLPHADAVRARHRGRGLEPLLQFAELSVEMRVQRQLALDDERDDEDDAGAAVGGEPAGEVERVLRLLPLEQGHDDAPVGDRLGPHREAPRAPPERPDVGQLHLIRWYGTEARITFGSTSSSRFT